jgi:hypothetical protein
MPNQSQVTGASAEPTGLSQQAAEPEVSALTGFDPSRWNADDYEGKPRHQPKEYRRELEDLIECIRAYMNALPEGRLETLFEAFKTVSPINCSWQHHALAKAFIYETASAIEARRAETQSGSVEDESAVAKPDAQGDAA